MDLNGSWEIETVAQNGAGYGVVGLLDGNFVGSDQLIGWRGNYTISETEIFISGEYQVFDEVNSIFGVLAPQTT